MRVPHCAGRLCTAAALSLALGACGGGDSNEPAPFNADGANADMQATQSAFETSALASFDATGSAMSVALSGDGSVVASLGMLRTPASAARYARALSRLVRPAPRISASAGAIPDSLFGTTFSFDATAQQYVRSDRTGAPGNGVRFLLYAVNPATGRPAEPLNEVGYADVVDQSSGTTVANTVTVVSGGTTYLQYGLSGAPTSQGGIVTIGGFVTNGTTRANFTLKNTIALAGNDINFTIDYKLDVPSRNLLFDYVAAFLISETAGNSLTLDLTMAGENGTVTLAGTGTSTGGNYTVKVNGDLFATITADGAGLPTVTGASGVALTASEEAALRVIFGWYGESSDFLGHLLDPVN